MFEFSWMQLLLAFCGGIFGAAIGALPAFVLCGAAALVGAAVSIATRGSVGLADQWVTWGPLLGPQSSFAGGVAAAAFAKRRGLLENGRDICSSLMGLNSPLVLLVGGLFGIIGSLATLGFSKLPPIGGQASTNAIACGIVLAMMIARLSFGRTGLLGCVTSPQGRWIPTSQGGWIAYQSSASQITLISLAVGLPTAHLTHIMPECGLFIFGMGVVAFAYMQFGTRVPVFHHLALAAYAATLATHNPIWGLAFALLAGFFCELAAMLFVYHGDTHIDPPTVALAATGTLQPILLASGLMPSGMTPGSSLQGGLLAAGVTLAGFVGFYLLRRENAPALSLQPTT